MSATSCRVQPGVDGDEDAARGGDGEVRLDHRRDVGAEEGDAVVLAQTLARAGPRRGDRPAPQTAGSCTPCPRLPWTTAVLSGKTAALRRRKLSGVSSVRKTFSLVAGRRGRCGVLRELCEHGGPLFFTVERWCIQLCPPSRLVSDAASVGLSGSEDIVRSADIGRRILWQRNRRVPIRREAYLAYVSQALEAGGVLRSEEPCSTARLTASARVLTPSLAKMCWT